MEIIISIAKIILAILPFLNRKSRIKGRWRAEYVEDGYTNRLAEMVEANQLWSLVWGKIKPIDNLSDPEWKFYGLIREQVLVGIYFAEEKLHHWQGSFTLSFNDDEKLLTGYYAGFEESTQTIVASSYSWRKLT